MKVTSIQTDLIWEDISANLKHFDQKIEEIGEPTDLLILPEMFSTGFTPNAAKVAEDFSGLAFSWLKSKAKEKKIGIIASFIFNDNGIFKNRLFFVMPNGEFSFYDKRHLFGTTEKESLTAGNERIIVQYKGWRILPLICYDLRFPVWARNKNDYDLLIFIANWPDKRIAHWQTLLKARAIENQSFTIGLNRIGVDGNGFSYNGMSMFVSPKGEEIGQIKQAQHFIQTLSLDKNEQDNYRKFFNVLSDADQFTIF
jgi:predicted amidohydrolase